MIRALALAAVLFVTAVAVPADDFGSQRRAIEEIRGLKFVRPVETTEITRAQFREELQERIGEGLAVPLQDHLRALEVLQFIPADSEVVDQLLDLYERQVLAFYDPARHRYFSISDAPAGSSLSADLDDAVVVHELTHALQDQVFDAGRKFESLRTNADGQLAYQAVLEGEATLVMLAFVYRSAGKSLDDLVNDDSIVQMLYSGAAAMDLGDGKAPAYFLDSLKFPYVEGFRLVLAAYRKGGWDEVNRLHGKRLPTTETVMHPAPFLSGQTSIKRFKMRKRAERCCRTLLATRLGEFHWRFLVGTVAADGWADDFVTVLSDPDGETVLVDTKWDRPADASEFARAYGELLAARKLEATVRVDGNRVRVAYGRRVELIEGFIGKRKR